MKRPAPPGSPEPDFLGKYKILRELGKADSSTIYEALDPAIGRRVFLKVLDLAHDLTEAQSLECIERFNHEAKVLGTLDHPNIVTLYDAESSNNGHFISMEYLEGHSLQEIEQMQGALPLRESLEIAMQAGDALGYAHSLGVVHRNMNADNIHILPGGIIKITNFEHATITTEPSITAHGELPGSPAYISPEQVASLPVDHRTDIFSLGVVLYEMLAGRRPFVGDSVSAIADNIINAEPPMPQRIPDTINAVLQRALAKDPDARYQTAGAFCSDLRKEKAAL